MTPDEARVVASVLTAADGGCGPCFDDLSKRMKKAFPEYDWWQLGKDNKIPQPGDRDYEPEEFDE